MTAGVLLIALLILIAIVVAGTAATGSTRTQTITAPAASGPTAAANAAAARRLALQAATLRADQASIGQMRALLSAQATQIAAATGRLQAAQADARCWHAKVQHPIRTRTVHCPPPAP